jgi:hypothetical protein
VGPRVKIAGKRPSREGLTPNLFGIGSARSFGAPYAGREYGHGVGEGEHGISFGGRKDYRDDWW